MLTINLIRENPSFVIERLKIKNFDATEIVNTVLGLDRRRRDLQMQSDTILAELNSLSKQIGSLYKTERMKKQKKQRHPLLQ